MPACPAAPAMEPMMGTAAATILLLASLGLGACSPPDAADEERRPAPHALEMAGMHARPAIVLNAMTRWM